MITICEECGKKYRIDPSKIKGAAARFKCRVCTHMIMVSKPQNRRDAADKVLAAAGGRLLDMYFCFGDYDGVAIAEFPYNVDAAAASLAIGSSGAFSQVKTTVLISMNESIQAMEKAGAVTGAYTPPAG